MGTPDVNPYSDFFLGFSGETRTLSEIVFRHPLATEVVQLTNDARHTLPWHSSQPSQSCTVPPVVSMLGKP